MQAFFEGEGAARHWVRSIGAVQDITERKLAEQALRLNQERFRTIITTAQEGIWAIDREAKTLFANPRMAELLGMLPEDMIGKPVTEFCFPADVFGARDRMAANFAGEKTQFEFRFRRSDGTPLHGARRQQRHWVARAGRSLAHSAVSLISPSARLPRTISVFSCVNYHIGRRICSPSSRP